jgi:isopentenyl diphosphate isomerase/L-lactate dehydrogenase-like FMN-dependent dehydrogenase
MINRAKTAGFEGLIVTVDMPLLPNREFNDRNGFGLPYKLTRRSVFDVASRPGWALSVLGQYLAKGGMPRYENYPDQYRQAITSNASSQAAMRTDSMTWEDLRVLRDRWQGSLLVKGILHPADAVKCCEIGADAVIVSNHGGRNVDSAVGAIDVLEPVVRAVDGRLPILFDSGIRRGGDIVKALALGACAVLVGRPVLWGTALGGAKGAEHCLQILQRELDITQGLLGCPDTKDIDGNILYRHAE